MRKSNTHLRGTPVPLLRFEAGPLFRLTLEKGSSHQPAHRAAALRWPEYCDEEDLAGAALRQHRSAPPGGVQHGSSTHHPAASMFVPITS